MATTKKTAAEKSDSGFSDAERAAMKARAEELRASGRGGNKKAEEAQALLDKIAEMPQPDRGYAERIHAIVTEVAPELHHKTWYGMPAYYLDGKPAIFFQPASKFDARYATLGFNDPARLDDGNMWPTSFALKELTAAEEERISALVKKAVS